MAYLHKDREQFRNAIALAYEQTGVMAQAIENLEDTRSRRDFNQYVIGYESQFCRIPVIPPAVSGTIHNLDTSKWKLYRPIIFSF